MEKRMGTQTVRLKHPVSICSGAAIVGQKEKEGPLGKWFDIIMPDAEWNEPTWEKTESKMQREAVRLAAQKGNRNCSEIQYIFGGDLMNQCIATGFGLRDLQIPFYGIYGACSTMIEGLSLAAMLIDGGFADCAAAVTSSHFCTAERQYRMPLEYGGQRPPTAQWTVTGAGAVLLEKGGKGPFVTHITTGVIRDLGVKDANQMGGAMAPAACDTLLKHFSETGRKPEDYDMIFTGDLGKIGKSIVLEQCYGAGVDLSKRYQDCGCLIYDRKKQDVHAGGSGCGCVASVLCGYILNQMRNETFQNVLVVGTGALLSPISGLQGESVPGIAHAVAISNKEVV